MFITFFSVIIYGQKSAKYMYITMYDSFFQLEEFIVPSEHYNYMYMALNSEKSKNKHIR